MTRHETIKEITEHLEHMDAEALWGLLKLLERKKEHLTAAGVPYTGDPETDAVLNDHPDILKRIERLESSEAKTRPLREVMAELGDAP